MIHHVIVVDHYWQFHRYQDEKNTTMNQVVLLNFDDNVGSQIFVATHELYHKLQYE